MNETKAPPAAEATVTTDAPAAPTRATMPMPDHNTPLATPSTGGSVPVTHERVLQPINDVITTTPDFATLLAKEEQNGAIPTPPATTVISPGGTAVTPSGPVTPPDPNAPGNVIRPVGGVDPNSIAL